MTMLNSLLFSENCVRTNKGYCRIQWQESPGTTPDTFQLDSRDIVAGTADTLALGGVLSPDPADPTTLVAIACALSYVQIPDGSVNGITPLPLPPSGWAFQSQYCGALLGLHGTTAPTAITCKSSFIALDLSDFFWILNLPNQYLIALSTISKLLGNFIYLQL